MVRTTRRAKRTSVPGNIVILARYGRNVGRVVRWSGKGLRQHLVLALVVEDR
jgi:hypothetical protein